MYSWNISLWSQPTLLRRGNGYKRTPALEELAQLQERQDPWKTKIKLNRKGAAGLCKGILARLWTESLSACFYNGKFQCIFLSHLDHTNGVVTIFSQ